MKSILIVSFACIASSATAWECGEHNRYAQPIQKNLQIAKDVIIGTVVEGKLEGKTNIKLNFEITLPIKGNFQKGKEIQLITNYTQPIEKFYVGGNYIVFLYGSNEVNFCSMYFELVDPVGSLKELYEYENSNDHFLKEKVKAVVKYAEKNPRI